MTQSSIHSLVIPSLTEEVDRIARYLAEHHFPDVAAALRNATDATVLSWRACSLEAMPELDPHIIDELEVSVAFILVTLASALECKDAESVRHLLEETPTRGIARFLPTCSPQTLLAEERILRSILVIELRRELGRPLSVHEAAALHELLDLMAEYSILALVNSRGRERERVIQGQMSGMHRLADLGTIVAGVAHDAVNLFLPLRMFLDHLQKADLPAAARDDIESVGLIVRQFQNSIVNLRWLSVDSMRGATSGPAVALNLREWATDVADFHQRMKPRGQEVVFDLSPPSSSPALPDVLISSAALSQAVFNLVRNSQHAIVTHGAGGRVVLSAKLRADGDVDLMIEDDGPGMTPEVLLRCMEAFFTTKGEGSGLGLALVHALVTRCGGSLAFQSPPPGKSHGTVAILTLPAAAGREVERS